MNETQPIHITGWLETLPVYQHPKVRLQRNRRKRRRLLKMLKRQGITEYAAPRLEWTNQKQP